MIGIKILQADVPIGNETEYVFPISQPGKIYKIRKAIAIDKQTNGTKVSVVSNSIDIKSPLDIAKMESEERKSFRKKFGSISHSLSEYLNNVNDNDTLEVVCYIKKNHPGWVDKNSETKVITKKTQKNSQRQIQ